jgi:pimeloyl-ACP methyl ester carboxylesterase
MPDEQPSGGPTVTHHTAQVNGIKVHYVMAGVGDPLVLLHGWPQTWREWRRVIPALVSRYTVIAPDLRGFGDSDKPASGYDKRTVAEDIYQLVRYLGLGPVKLVGQDLGMMVAYTYACVHPNEVCKLVLAEAGLPGLGLEGFFDTARYPQFWHFGFFSAPNNVAESLIVGRERLFVSHFIRMQSYDPYGVPEEDLDEYARRLAAPGALRGGFEHYRAFPVDAEHNREHSQTKLPMPVLTVGGERSIGDGLEKMMKPLALHVRGVVIKRCGHYIADERPEEFARELLQFFGGQE